MKMNHYLLQFSLMLIVLFGGLFLLRWIKDGDMDVLQLIGCGVGVVLFVTTLIWGVWHKKKQKGNINDSEHTC